MSAHNEEEDRLEGNTNHELPRDLEHDNEGILATQVLEAMRNLIVELEAFKEDNKKLKKAHEDQLEINETFLHSTVTNKSAKDNEK